MSNFDRENVFTNADGLNIGFGTRTEATNSLAKVASDGARETARMVIDFAGLEDTDSVTAAGISEQSLVLPRGSLIHSAVLQVHTAFDSAGDAATLDIGTYDADLSSITVDDADGIDVDIAEAALDTIGEVVRCNGALVDGLVTLGATSNSNVVVVAAFQTEAFTAGRGVLIIEYSVPAGPNATLAV